MKRFFARAAASAVAVLLVLPGVALSQEAPPEEVPADEALAEAAVEEVGEAVDTAQEVLDIELTLDPGNGEEPITVSFDEALEQIASGSVLDPEGTGSATNVGNVMHIYIDANVETFGTLGQPASAPLPPEPDLTHYDVVESGYVPATPIVPVPNPLLLTGTELPEGAPEGLGSPILFLHAGGKLKNVRGSGWDSGTHTVGSGPLGPNIDTSEGAPEPWPVWLPVVTGDVVPDTSIDFTGFAIVIEGQGCSLIQATLPFLGLRTFARICVGFGTLIGDGLTFFNGDAPVDVREVLAPVWEPVPPPLDGVVATLEEVLASIPVGDLLAQILGAVPPPPTGMSGASGASLGRLTTGLLK